MIVALIGLVVSLFAYLIAFPHRDRRRFDIYLPLLVLHLTMAVAYWLYHFEAAMDAFTYYRDPYNFFQGSPFTSGTYFIVHVVQTLKETFGGSFLDYFLFFQCFGMLGMALLIRSFGEVAESLQIEVPTSAYFVLFIPGLHFWSVAIGKDAPMFMAVALAVWASIQVHRRFLWMGLAVLIMIAIRPHVGALVLLGASVAFLTARAVPSLIRILMIPIALGGLLVTARLAGNQFGVDVADASSLTGFFEYQQGLNASEGSGNNIASLAFPLKILTLLFRPIFFDAVGAMGYVASVENIAFILIFGYIFYHWRDTLRLVKHAYHMAFCAVFSTGLILALSLVNYNLGLGQRQKMMVMPAVLLIFASLYLYRRYQAVAAAPAAATESATEPDSETTGYPAPAKA